MPKNRLIYAGILLIAAAAVLWVAYQILKRVEWSLFGVGVIGVVLIVIGLVMEAREGKAALKPGDTPGEPLITIPERTDPPTQPAAAEPVAEASAVEATQPTYGPDEPH